RHRNQHHRVHNRHQLHRHRPDQRNNVLLRRRFGGHKYQKRKIDPGQRHDPPPSPHQPPRPPGRNPHHPNLVPPPPPTPPHRQTTNHIRRAVHNNCLGHTPHRVPQRRPGCWHDLLLRRVSDQRRRRKRQ